ncbi:MAG: hypothetical protein IJD95_03045 [Clostridia bacterium]|nr:hypothetical protein [Clostridia bacterium]
MNFYYKKIADGSIAVDDTVLVKGVPAAAGSRILEGFTPLFSAEAVTRLENKGYVISGKTNVGEFGLDLAGEFSYYAPAESEIKGAAAEAVKSGEVNAALAVDVNGAARRAAALSDVYFLKPTYGTVSRYGIISTAASGEQLGVYASCPEGISEIMSVISGHDEKDGTSLKNESYDYGCDKELSGKRICIVKELYQKADASVKAEIDAFAASAKKKGVSVSEISTDIFETANVAYQILMCAESCNNLSRYDGVKFGYRAESYKNIDELYVNSRTEGFNFLTKAVILYGSDVLSKNRYKDCYDKSLRVRRVVMNEMKKLFESFDAVIAPVCSLSAYGAYDIKDAFKKVFEESEFTALANLIGLPALACGKVQIIGDHFSESTLLSLAKEDK